MPTFSDLLSKTNSKVYHLSSTARIFGKVGIIFRNKTLVPTEVLNTLKKKKLLITEGLTVLY
jgi:hypothetical protein